MAKKAELLAIARELELSVNEKNTIAEIEAAINSTKNVENSIGQKHEKNNNTAKSGKRSEKGQRAAQEKIAKIEAQKHRDEKSPVGDKVISKRIQKVRPRLERKGKNIRKATKLIDKSKAYNLSEAVELACKTSFVKFDATVEIHIRLNIDPRQADQNIRDTIILPFGTGVKKRIAVYADDTNADIAKKAGADIVETDEFLQILDKGKIDFDILIATPKVMPKLGKYAKLLGPKGLMPNPKSGTVTDDINRAVKDAKAGRVEYRIDSTGIIHAGVGRVSFGKDKLIENVKAMLLSVKSNKPSSLKGTYVNSIFLSTTMGPSINLDVAEI